MHVTTKAFTKESIMSSQAFSKEKKTHTFSNKKMVGSKKTAGSNPCHVNVTVILVRVYDVLSRTLTDE